MAVSGAVSKRVGMSVAAGGSLLLLGTTLSRFLGLIRGIVIAYYFGQNTPAALAFTNASSLPDVIFYLVAGGALSSTFIPVFTELYTTGKEKEAWRCFSTLINVVFLVTSALVVIAALAAPTIVATVQTEHPEINSLTTSLLLILLPGQVIFMIGTVVQATLYARKEYTAPSLAPNIYNLGIILGAILVRQFVTPAVAGPCYGAIVGAFVGALFIPTLAMFKHGARYRPIINLRDPNVKRVFKLMLPVIIGLSLPSVFGLILMFFSNKYGDKGIPNAFLIANNLFQSPTGIFGQSLAMAVFPYLSELHAKGETKLFLENYTRTLRQTFYLATPVAFIMGVAAPQVVAMLYQHGAFTATDTERTASILRILCIGIPAWCAIPVLMRAFYATHETKTPVIIGTVATAFFIGLCSLNLYLGLPFYDLGYCVSITAYLLVIVLYNVLKNRVGSFKPGELWATLLLTTWCSVMAGGVVYLGVMGFEKFHVYDSFNGMGVWPHRLALVGVNMFLFCCAGWVYYLATKASGMDESKYIERAMNRRKKKKPPT